MRITNQMMTNNVLLNINRNKSKLSGYEQQVATGKKIQKASDDPVIAVRALRFRTTVKEINQYKTNAQDAISWANVSEQAVSNVTDIFKRVRELAVQSSSDIMNISNRKNTVTEIGELMNQFLNETNASYAGRHVFGGYKTNTPIVYNKPDSDHYKITEHFGAKSVEKVSRVANLGSGDRIITAHRIRTGYSKGTNGDGTALLAALGGTFTTMNSMQSNNPAANIPAPGVVNFIEDTGELVFNSANVGSIPASFDFSYQKTDFKRADLVPKHYFDCTNITTGEVFKQESEEVKYQISYSQEITVNTMAKDVVSVGMQRDIEELITKTESITANGSLNSKLEEDLVGDMFSKLLGKLDTHIDSLLSTRVAQGGKINRLELTVNRLEADQLNFTDLMSQNEDLDYAETYIKMSSMESVYQASLNASTKILQPTLLDFIR